MIVVALRSPHGTVVAKIVQCAIVAEIKFVGKGKGAKNTRHENIVCGFLVWRFCHTNTGAFFFGFFSPVKPKILYLRIQIRYEVQYTTEADECFSLVKHTVRSNHSVAAAASPRRARTRLREDIDSPPFPRVVHVQFDTLQTGGA